MLNDSKLMKCYRLTGAQIMSAVELIRDALTSLAQGKNVLMAEITAIVTLKHLASGKI